MAGTIPSTPQQGGTYAYALLRPEHVNDAIFYARGKESLKGTTLIKHEFDNKGDIYFANTKQHDLNATEEGQVGQYVARPDQRTFDTPKLNHRKIEKMFTDPHSDLHITNADPLKYHMDDLTVGWGRMHDAITIDGLGKAFLPTTPNKASFTIPVDSSATFGITSKQLTEAYAKFSEQGFDMSREEAFICFTDYEARAFKDNKDFIQRSEWWGGSKPMEKNKVLESGSLQDMMYQGFRFKEVNSARPNPLSSTGLKLLPVVAGKRKCYIWLKKALTKSIQMDMRLYHVSDKAVQDFYGVVLRGNMGSCLMYANGEGIGIIESKIA